MASYMSFVYEIRGLKLEWSYKIPMHDSSHIL